MPKEKTGAAARMTVPGAAPALAGLLPLAATTMLVVSGCGHGGATATGVPGVAVRDTGDDPATVRRGFGNAQLHTWWPLTASEQAALRELGRARAGDAHALLSLAILASGDGRDVEGVARIHQRVDAFVAAVKPVIDRAPDDWHRGYELHRAMHRTFFTGGGGLQGYAIDQSRLTGVFSSGTYNCLSSAVLFVVLARAFDLPVRGVVVPSHVFVEMGRPGQRPVEIETTSSLGFDLVHDARFFQEQGAAWASQRGLPAVTFGDYQRRSIVSPVRLMALAMVNVHPGEREDDGLRLHELAAVVDPDDGSLQRERLVTYNIEANRLLEEKALRTMAHLFDVVSPAMADIGGRVRDGEVARVLSLLNWYYGHALLVVGRRDQARAIMDAGIDRIDPRWAEADTLRNNYLALLIALFAERVDAKDFPGAEAVIMSHLGACQADAQCIGNFGVLYLNWSGEHYNAGNWPAARKVLQTCVTNVPEDRRCRERLTELEREHRF